MIEPLPPRSFEKQLRIAQNLIFQKHPVQTCISCGATIGAVAGTKEAICQNCGYKDPCCE